MGTSGGRSTFTQGSGTQNPPCQMPERQKGSKWMFGSCLLSCSCFQRIPPLSSTFLNAFLNFAPQSPTPLGSSLNFKYLKVVLCLLPTCYFLRKKIQVPSTTTQETMLPPIWLPFFRTTFIFIHVHTYLIQVDVALRVVPWGSQERCNILGNI